MKYYLFELIEQNGEQEYRQNVIQEIEDDIKPMDRLTDLCLNWYDESGEDEEDDLSERRKELIRNGSLDFLGGTIIVTPAGYTQITKEEYDIFKKYNI